MPWDGINAVDGARKVLERLDRLSLGNEHPGLGKATLTVTQIKSAPEISHTVPDSCRITLDRRLLPGDDPEMVLREIRDARNRSAAVVGRSNTRRVYVSVGSWRRLCRRIGGAQG